MSNVRWKRKILTEIFSWICPEQLVYATVKSRVALKLSIFSIYSVAPTRSHTRLTFSFIYLRPVSPLLPLQFFLFLIANFMVLFTKTRWWRAFKYIYCREHCCQRVSCVSSCEYSYMYISCVMCVGVLALRIYNKFNVLKPTLRNEPTERYNGLVCGTSPSYRKSLVIVWNSINNWYLYLCDKYVVFPNFWELFKFIIDGY